MSRTIDERVVEMRFDNKEFESRAKQSIGTLTKLKEALNLSTKESTTKGLEQLSKASQNLSLDGITAGVEALQKRFSTLGIVGMRAIENITDSMMGTLGKGIHFVTDSIVSGGIKRAMNIENAHFQLQALLKDEAKVQAVMADAMESVDGTAYAYDEAAKAAAQFAASGLQAGEEMLGALKGITGVAAMTNSDFESISQIFTTVAGNGRLMGDQLLQLSSRGLNAASTIAEYFREVRGQANITEADIREMVTKGKLDFKTFSDAMTYAFGDSAKRANETFTGALSNMKSALARIGAGFISPLVEQNSEMVKLFNALREQINSVKSSLVFDEQKSALSGMTKQADLMVETISSLARDGTVEFDQFTTAILGTSKSEEELARSNQALSESYNKVKENGSATLDTLIDFKKNGINASEAVREYVNGVLDGSIKASDAVKESVKEISGGTNLIVGDVARLAKEGKISYDIFTNAIVNSSGAVAKGSELVGTAVESMMSKIKESGTVTADNLIELNQNGLNAAIALKDYITGVADGSIRASYSMTQAVQEITDENGKLSDSVLQLAKDGKISYDMLQSAMQETYGDQRALSKQFTDFFLDSVKSLVTTIQEIDMTKPMEVFYHWVDITKNVLKGFLSVLKPIASAFSEIFLSFSADDVINFSSKIESFTAKLRLSERGSKNLRDTFKGLFSVAKLVLDVFVKLVGIFVPITKPIGSLSDGILSLTGAIGRSLTSFTEWIHSSSLIRKAYDTVSKAVRNTMNYLKNFIDHFDRFLYEIYQLEPVQELVVLVSGAFEQLGKTIRDGLVGSWQKVMAFIKNVEKSLSNISGSEVKAKISELAKSILNVINKINIIDTTKAKEAFESLKKALKGLIEVIKGNEGLSVFTENMRQFFERLAEAFKIDKILEKIDNFRTKITDFIGWAKEKLGALSVIFGQLSFGGVVSTAGGIGLIIAIIKMAKSFEKVTTTIEKIPQILGSINGVIVEYQRNIKADTVKKVAAAILMLSGALVLLSFADMEKVAVSALALSAVVGILLAGINKFLEVAKKTKTVEDVVYRFSKAANQIAKGVKWKLIGLMFQDFGTAILKIIIAMAAVFAIYKKDPEALKVSGEIVAMIAGIMMGMILVMSGVGQKLSDGMSSFAKASAGILFLAIALTTAVKALNKLFEISLPDDWGKKVAILAGIFGALGLLAIALGKASKEASGSMTFWNGGSGTSTQSSTTNGKLGSTPILALTAMLYVSVLALERLFNLTLPNDYLAKCGILAGVFLALIGVILAIGKASEMAGGALKATGTLLSLCLFVVVIVGALKVLEDVSIENLAARAGLLGLVLIGLSVSLYAAGKIATPDTYKTVLSMAFMVAAILVALGILAIVPVDLLLKGGIALGALLLLLAADFAIIGKLKNEKAYAAILSMSAVILAVGVALSLLTGYDWTTLLASAASLSLTLLAMSGVMFIISKSDIGTKGIITFVAGAVALIPAAFALSLLAGYDWNQIWPAMVALGSACLALIAVIAALGALGSAGIGIVGIVLFVAAAIALVPMAYAIKEIMTALTGLKWEDVSGGLISLAAALAVIGVAGLLIGPISPMILALSASLIVFAGAITLLGFGLVSFMESLLRTLNLMKMLLDSFPKLQEFYEVGKNIIMGIVNGILASVEKLWDTVKGVGQGIIKKLKGELDEHSPSKEMFEIGMYADEGLANGITGGEGMIDNALGGIGSMIKDKIANVDLFSDGEGMISDLTAGISSGGDDTSAAFTDILNNLQTGDGLNSFFSYGEAGYNKFDEGFGAAKRNKKFGSSIENWEDVDLSEFYAQGEEGSNSFLEGFGSGNFDFQSILSGNIGDYDSSQFNLTGEQSATEFFTGFQNGSRNSVNEAAAELVSLFCEAILESFKGKVPEVATDMQSELMIGIVKANTSLSETGYDSADSWLNGIRSRYTVAVTVGSTLAAYSVNGLQDRIPMFLTKGTNSATEYLKGIEKKYPDAKTTGKNLANKVLEGVKSVDFGQAGKDAVKGFSDGISSSKSLASSAGASLGMAAYEAARKSLDEHSPSKKMAEVGEYAGLGFVTGLMYLIAKAGEAGEAVGNEAVKGASDAIGNISRVITDDMFSDPVIRPTVDLSSVQRSVADVNKLFNQAIAFSADNAVSVSGTIAASRSKKSGSEIQNQENSGKQIIMNYEQNNYSPKALNSVEIYRQTKNMMSMAKGAINNA